MITNIPTETPDSLFLRRVNEAIKIAADEVQEKIIKEAVADFEIGLREAIGRIATRISSFYSIQSGGPGAVITVRILKEEKS